MIKYRVFVILSDDNINFVVMFCVQHTVTGFQVPVHSNLLGRSDWQFVLEDELCCNYFFRISKDPVWNSAFFRRHRYPPFHVFRNFRHFILSTTRHDHFTCLPLLNRCFVALCAVMPGAVWLAFSRSPHLVSHVQHFLICRRPCISSTKSLRQYWWPYYSYHTFGHDYVFNSSKRGSWLV